MTRAPSTLSLSLLKSLFFHDILLPKIILGRCIAPTISLLGDISHKKIIFWEMSHAKNDFMCDKGCYILCYHTKHLSFGRSIMPISYILGATCLVQIFLKSFFIIRLSPMKIFSFSYVLLPKIFFLGVVSLPNIFFFGDVSLSKIFFFGDIHFLSNKIILRNTPYIANKNYFCSICNVSSKIPDFSILSRIFQI
jgi:hypothetical protein